MLTELNGVRTTTWLTGSTIYKGILGLVFLSCAAGCAVAPTDGTRALPFLNPLSNGEDALQSIGPAPAGATEAEAENYYDYMSMWGDTTVFASPPPVEYVSSDLLEANPMIVGRLPGQTALPKAHFNEAADPNAADGATIVLLPDDEPADLWTRIRNNLDFPQHDHPGAAMDLAWYARHQAYLDRVTERARPYLYYIVNEVERRDMPMEVALLPIVESAFQPFAYSHGRAAGIWQFIPGTGKLFGLKQNWWYDGRRDVVAATNAALTYLQTLNRHFDGDWLLALAAYNSGEGTVRRAIRKNKRRGKPTDFWSLDLPRETRGYVPKLLAIAEIVNDPQAHSVTLASIPNEPFFEQIDIGSQIDLALAADLAGISMEDLYTLNPAFNRWATDPKGPHRLAIPVESVDTFREKLAELPSDQRIQWDRHAIRKGETLGQIAEKFHTSVAMLKRINAIRGNMIREGQNLIIPVATKSLASYTLSADQRLRSTQNTRHSGREKVVHVVRSGDTLWDLSRAYKVGVRELAKWNGMAPRDTLQTGQKLIVWTKGKRLAARSRFSPHDSSRVTQKIGYRVRRGDSLARISQRFKVSINDLVRWNGLRKNKYLQPGQYLTLYVDVTTQAGI